MDAFITRAATDFDRPPETIRALCAAVLWVMQLSAPEAFARVHTADPRIRVLVDAAPAVLARARDPHTRRTDHALLRLFARSGFSLGQAGRFTQTVLDVIASHVGLVTVLDIVDHAPVVELLIAEQTVDLSSALASIA